MTALFHTSFVTITTFLSSRMAAYSWMSTFTFIFENKIEKSILSILKCLLEVIEFSNLMSVLFGGLDL